MPKYAVILPAAGRSSRFNDQHYKKPFIPLNDRAVWLHAVEPFLRRSDVVQTILVISEEDREAFQQKFSGDLTIHGIDLAIGGEQRSDSVRNGLAKVRDEVDFVAIHDAARPCITEPWITDVFRAAESTGAAILATPIRGTVKRADKEKIIETVPRDGLWEAQTPQVFRRGLLENAYADPPHDVTDDAQVMEMLGVPVTIVEGSPLNLKITTRGDLQLAQTYLASLRDPPTASPPAPFEDNEFWR